MTGHFNQLTPAQAERLALLLEELGEAQQVIGKILRHGYESVHPNGGSNNRELLQFELGDVHHAIDRLCVRDLDADAIYRRSHEKWDRAQKYMHHQPPPPRALGQPPRRLGQL